MTLQQNRVLSITLLLEVRFYNYFTELITIIIEMMCRAQHLGCFLQGHSMTLQPERLWPITLLFKVGLYNYLTERIINGKKQELMIIKKLFEGSVGDYQMLVFI